MLGSSLVEGLTGADGAGVATATLPDLLARCEAVFFLVMVDLPMRFCSVVWPLNLRDIWIGELHASTGYFSKKGALSSRSSYYTQVRHAIFSKVRASPLAAAKPKIRTRQAVWRALYWQAPVACWLSARCMITICPVAYRTSSYTVCFLIA